MHTLNKTGLVPITNPPPQKKGANNPNPEKEANNPKPWKGVNEPPTPKRFITATTNPKKG